MTQAAVPSNNAHVSETAVLGPLKEEYKVHQAKNKANQLFGKLFLVVGPLMLIYALVTTITASSDGLNYFCGSLGLLACLAGGYAFWEQRRDKSISVRVHADGLAYLHSGTLNMVRWDDVEAARMSVLNVKSRYSKNSLDTVYGYTITPTIGPDIAFRFNKNSIRNIDALSNTIQQEVTRRLLPKAIAAYNQGGTVQFGKLSLDQMGISNGKESISWSEVEDLKVSRGIITIRKSGKWLSWSSIAVGETPNIFVFLALVNGILKRQPGLAQSIVT